MRAPYDPLGRIAREPDALEAFYRDHVDAVQRFVARRVSDPHLAADLTADVFLAAVDSAAGAQVSASLDANTLARAKIVGRYGRSK